MTHGKRTGVTSSRLNRRTLIGGSAAAATGSLLAGKRSSAFAAPMLNFRQDKIILEFWAGEREENGPGDLVSRFNEAHPDIEARYTQYVNDDTGNTQLDTALQGGTQIDVYQSYGVPRTSQRIMAGAALDLGPYIDTDQAIKDWLETVTVFTYQDSYYSLPTVRDLFIIHANMQLLEDAGVTLPESWTIDEFREMAKQLSSDDVYGSFAPTDTAIQILGPNRWYKEGGTESNFDHPAFKEELERRRAMIEEGSAFPWTDVLARDLRIFQHTVFLTGQVALWSVGSWVLNNTKNLEEFPHEFVTTFTSVPTPVGVEDPWAPGTIDNNILINPKTEHQDAAWEFLRFRLGDGASSYLKGSKEPALPGTPIEDIVTGILGENREELFDVEAYQRAISRPDARIPVDTVLTAGAQIQQIYQQESDRYLIGEIDIEECMTNIKTKADQAIADASA